MSDTDALPAPGDRYFEIEAAKLHGGWSVWERIHPVRRAELIAHEMHKNMRDHYYLDKQKEKDGTAKKPAVAPWDAYKQTFWDKSA